MATKGETMPTETGLPLRSRLLIAAMASLIGILLGATVFGPGAASAQEATTSTTLAQDEESTTARLANHQKRIRASLDSLVTDGTITAAQADAVAARLAESFPGRGRGLRIHAGLDVAAATIGISEANLVEALRDGQTIAEVAEAGGVTAQAVIDALVAEINRRVDEAVAEGNIDSDRATEIKANAVEKATAWVNGEGGFPGRFRGGDRGETPDTGA